ncbi:polysaccharide deacetylase family protein [Domibacillus aminovorans]|uniref:polysaccharide deacetylase family protein n=1 Tax=Domibacillus aminovorans TaxID=29332 RepID=UPI0012FD3934|nr:polysaccharide deacetylase family protein [Domibacillus aminovorans]
MGLSCYVTEENRSYRLVDGITNNDWQDISKLEDPDFSAGSYELPGEDVNLYRIKSKGITHTVVEIASPDPNVNGGNEATIALMREVDGESGGPEFVDIYNNGYEDSRQAGIRIQSRGTGQLRPFVIDFFNGVTRTETFRTLPNGESHFKGELFLNGEPLTPGGQGGVGVPFDPVNTEGVVLLTGSDFGGWVKRYGDRMEADTVNRKHARQGVKILMAAGDANMTAIRNNYLAPIDLSRTATIRVNLFVVNAHNIVDLELYFAETADYTNFISYRIGEGKLSEGWNELIIDTASYIVEGVADLTTAKTSMQIRGIPAETGGCELTFDSIVGYKKGKAKAIFTFDDGWLSQYTKAFPLLQARGFRGNIGVVPTWIDEIVDPAYEKVMSYNQLAHLYEYGWDLFNHTYSHPNLNNGTVAVAVSQVEQCRDWLNNEGWTRASEILAYPYGGHINIAANPDFRNVLRYARSLVEGIDSNVIPDKMRGKTRNLIDGVTPASVITDIDTTIEAGGTIVFTNHLIADTPPADPYGMYYSTANFTQILDYLYTNRDEIEVITLSEWVRYMESVQM